MALWWLSFADPTRPTGQQLLGAAIVEAPTMEATIPTAWLLGCNPGGQVMVYALPAGAPIPAGKIGILFPPDEARRVGASGF